MGMFQELLTDLKNNDDSTIELIHDASKEIEQRRSFKDAGVSLNDVDYTFKEEIIEGYLVAYQYRQKKAKVKGKNGEDSESIFSEMKIISVVQFFTNEIIDDEHTMKKIHHKIVEKIDQSTQIN